MRATIKTGDGKVFTGELVEESKGFERIVGNLRISASIISGTTDFPVRISVLKRYHNSIPGDVLDKDDVKDIIKALQDASDYYEENR